MYTFLKSSQKINLKVLKRRESTIYLFLIINNIYVNIFFLSKSIEFLPELLIYLYTYLKSQKIQKSSLLLKPVEPSTIAALIQPLSIGEFSHCIEIINIY